MHRPLIGITTAYSPAEPGKIPVYTSYARIAENVAAAGGLPVLIPVTVDDDTLRGIYDRLDGVLLPGGGDIDSKHWGEPLHDTVYGLDASRDHAEINIVRWAISDDLPLFGICRGHQIINVALGAKLIQDIPSLYPTELTHANFSPTPRGQLSHVVGVQADSRLAQILGETQAVPVNSIHHQAVSQAAPGMKVAALAPDGMIEATEMPGHRFALSVQWHPEDLGAVAHHFNLFKAFVHAAASEQ